MMNHPSSLTCDDLRQFRGLLAKGSISAAYDELAARGYRFAVLANGVVQGDSFFGRMAMEFLRKTAEAKSRPLQDAELDDILCAMAVAYVDALESQIQGTEGAITRDVLADEAWKFHCEVFQSHGLDPDAWTLHAPYSLMDAEARQVYWMAALSGAGDFAKEVLLGVATEVIMKQAAADLLAPRTAARARDWLRRLHDLDSYRAAAEVVDLRLDEVCLSLPVERTHDGLTAASVRRTLAYVDQTLFDELLKSKLSPLGRRFVGALFSP